MEFHLTTDKETEIVNYVNEAKSLGFGQIATDERRPAFHIKKGVREKMISSILIKI